MVTFFAKLFIKDLNNTTSPQIRQAYGILCGAVGILLNILLFLGKFFAGTVSRSISITADAFNNLSDAGSSFITLIGFKLAGQKPDPSHPFGHGRVEYLSGLIVSGAILIMAFELLKSSVMKIIHPEEVDFSPAAILILIISICVKIYMFYYNRKIGRKIDSAAMKATALDSLSDSLATSVVLAAAIISQLTHFNIDSYCGVLVGLFILYAGICAAKDTLNPLLGQAPKPEFVSHIHEIVMAHEEVLGIHDLIVHDYGPGRQMISLHAEVSSSGNILALHDAIDNIEHELREKLHCDAVIHMDPIADKDEETITLKKELLHILHDLDPIIAMHDFRIVKGPTHTNIIFDIVVPFEYKLKDEELKKKIDEKVKSLNAQYFTVIEVDKAYMETN